ncbi:MAG: hypothetical protein PWP23_172 [Candidatus Sumerlaeota bacterium]|nr:hypothetical protein [Candidatus Sumerlaeota bacterium]
MPPRQPASRFDSTEALVHFGFAVIMAIVGAIIGIMFTTIILLRIHAGSGGDRWWGPGILIGGGLGAIDGIVLGYLKDLARRSHKAARLLFTVFGALSCAYLAGLVTFPVPDLPYYDFLPKLGAFPRLCTASTALAFVVGAVVCWNMLPWQYDSSVWH